MTRHAAFALRTAILSVALLAGAAPTTAGTPDRPAATESGPGGVEAAPVLVEDPLGAVPADDPRMEAYSHGGYLMFAARSLWSIGVLVLVVWSGFGSRLQRLAGRITGRAVRRANLEVAVYAALLGVVTFAASFPLRIYRSFVREKAYGFANQTFAAWLGDQGKGLLVSIALQAIFFTLLYVAIRRLGRTWWVAGGVLGVIFLVLAMAVAPVFIDPLFNTFEPLKDKALRAEILEMAQTQGIPAGEVYQVDASRQSEHNNAYVTGLLGSQRIVLYDTILRRFSPREIRFVMGHEMGHYVLNHVWKSIALLSLLVFAAFYLIDRVARTVIARRPSLGIAGLAEPASLPLMLLLLSGFVLLLTPVIATVSRAQEHQADVFGLEVVKDPAAAASSFVKFGRYDLSEYEVHPLIEALLYSHPSPANRIRFAQEYARKNGAAAPAGAR
jgi:STE24 endopeptidase